MARANLARWHGDNFQARLFWLKAAALLDPASSVTAIAFEAGPKSFDDITITHDPAAAPLDHKGVPVLHEHIQCKWHTKPGAFGHADLTDPAFINAQRDSFLQKAHNAQRQYAPDGTGCRFQLLTNWRVDLTDPLSRLIRKESNALDLDVMFDGTKDRSRMGKVRKAWREHLGIDDDALQQLARTLVLAEAPASSLSDLRERLDDKFAAVGMKRAPANATGFPCDDLTAKLLAQGRNEFDRDSFRQLLDREGLLAAPDSAPQAPVIGIRSFMHPIDDLSARCDRMLNLVPYFDGRYIRNTCDWEERIAPAIRGFIIDAARAGDSMRLILDAHVSLAFAVGALLNVKSGKRVEIEQRGGGRRFWSMDDTPSDVSWPSFNFDDELLGGGDEVALAIGLTHDVSPAVSAFVRQAQPNVGRIVHCKPEGGPSQQSVYSGRHAWMLAESAVQCLRALRGEGCAAMPVHIFIAGPNGFTFFLGQQKQAIGPAVLYEWDFDGQRGGGYSAGLSVGLAPSS